MNNLIRKTKQIANKELFYSKRIRLFLNLFILAVCVALQLNDFTMKISANYLVVIWVGINSYYTTFLYTKENRNFLLHINYLKNIEKFFVLFRTILEDNFIWLIFLFIQLYLLKASIAFSVIFSLLQYLFAIIFGMMIANTFLKEFGVILWLVLGLINFTLYNPYKHDAYSHFFSISEQLYNLEKINLLSFSKYISIIFAGFLIFCHQLNINDSKRRIKNT